jgi:tetratricopeptide (TPR) repeat protein
MKISSQNKLIVAGWLTIVLVLVVVMLPTDRRTKTALQGPEAVRPPMTIQLVKEGFRAMGKTKEGKEDKSGALRAEVIFSRAHQMDPDNPQILFGLAWAKARRGAPPAQWQTLYRRSANEGIKWASWSFFNLAQGERRSGRHAQALAYYQRACSLRPEDYECWYAIGVESLVLKKAQQALQAFERSIKLNPKNAWAHYHQGRAYHALGRQDRRDQSWARALQLKPDLKTEMIPLKTAVIPSIAPPKSVPKIEQNRR